MRSILALLAVAAVAAAFQLTGAQPAQAQCSVLSHHPCMPPGTPCSVLSNHPCNPGGCSVFRRGPCFPEILPSIGQDLRLTITSTDTPRTAEAGDKTSGSGDANNGTDRKLNSIRDMFDALRACWVPPPEDAARHGMQMSVRLSFKRDGEIIGAPRVTYASPDAPAQERNIYHDAISAALERCTPMQFSAGLGGAVAGRPIAIRYVDNRTIQ